MTNFKNIEEAKKDINKDLNFLKEIIESDYTTISDQIHAGAIIQQLITTSQEYLKPLKAKLRNMSVASGDSKYQAKSDHSGVIASVITPKPTFQLNDDFNVDIAKSLPSYVNLVNVDTKYKLKKGAVDTIFAMSEQDREKWMRFIKSTKSTPRVSINFVK